jgi:hypothetical protein
MANTMPAQAQSADESLFTTLYHSGVGWLNDILETEVFIDVSFKFFEDPPCIKLSFTLLFYCHTLTLMYIFSYFCLYSLT